MSRNSHAHDISHQASPTAAITTTTTESTSREANSAYIMQRNKSGNVINVYFQNVRGLRTKLDILRHSLSLSFNDIFIFTEKWLNDDFYSNELGFHNFNVF